MNQDTCRVLISTAVDPAGTHVFPDRQRVLLLSTTGMARLRGFDQPSGEFDIPAASFFRFAGQDPEHGTGTKFIQVFLTAFVSVPTLLTIFTITASLEIAGRLRGGSGVTGATGGTTAERSSASALNASRCGRGMGSACGGTTLIGSSEIGSMRGARRGGAGDCTGSAGASGCSGSRPRRRRSGTRSGHGR